MTYRILLCLLFTAATFAQSPPVITTISPTSGPASGGTTVTITGQDLDTPVVCILPCPPQVVFGDIAVDATQESRQRLVVGTPAHEPGTVDLTIAITGRPPVTLKDAFTFTAGAEAGYERVLLPVYLEEKAPGAFGSEWQTDFWIRNNGTEPVRLAPWECPPNLACPPVFPLTHTLLPGKTLHNPADLSSGGRTNPSQLVYVTTPSDVSMRLRVADVTRNQRNGGTDIPVIRENELLRAGTQLFDVPMNTPDFRVLLRIYELAYTKADFEVRLYPMEDDSSPIHAVLLTASTRQEGAFRSEAAYAQLDFNDLLKLRKAWPAAVRVEVIPRTPGSRFWVFASATNNETQLVTLVTPQ